jgi:hypothetical protein
MNFPKYWAKGSTEFPLNVRNPSTGGEGGSFSCWGWSNVSVEEAGKKGAERAAAVEKIIRERGWADNKYSYGDSDRPFREEVLEEWADGDEAPYAIVSINSYGCRVLNTNSVMFVDVDLPEQGCLALLTHTVKSLFGVGGPSPREVLEGGALAKLRDLAQSDSKFGVRVYRTSAGLRYLLTHAHADPASATTSRIMELLGADPLYVKLCERQECFRARLTPKPWRCGMQSAHKFFPWADEAAEQRFRDWEREYSGRAEQFASCHYVTQMGVAAVDQKIARVVEFHDKETKALSGTLALA